MRSISVEEAEKMVRLCGGTPGNLYVSNAEWKKLFIKDSRGIQIGRLTFQNDELKYIKSYKKDYHDSVDETDLIFMRISKLAETGGYIVVPASAFWAMWEDAKKLAEEHLVKMRAWREAHPVTKLNPKTGKPKSRKKLQGRNPRNILQQMVHAY